MSVAPTAVRLLVAVHRNAAPWLSDTAPRLIADLVVKDRDNQTIRSVRLLGAEDTPTGKCIGWQELDAAAVDTLTRLLDSQPTVTVSRGIGGQVEVVLDALDAASRSTHSCRLMGDTSPLYHCDTVTEGQLNADRAIAVRTLLDEVPQAIPARPAPFFQANRTYTSTGRQRIWNGITYALCRTQPAQVFQCLTVTTGPDGEQIAFGLLQSTASTDWTPDGLGMTAWELGWKDTGTAPTFGRPPSP